MALAPKRFFTGASHSSLDTDDSTQRQQHDTLVVAGKQPFSEMASGDSKGLKGTDCLLVKRGLVDT